MRILIDECVDQRLRFAFVPHECETAAYAISGLGTVTVPRQTSIV